MTDSTIRYITLLCVMCICSAVYGQGVPDTTNTRKSHKLLMRGQKNKYLDDQLYVGFTYNILTSMPSDVKNYSFSNTLSFGYIRDIPLNKRRNIGIAAGVGLGYHTYYTNVRMGRDENGVAFMKVLDDGQYQSNRFSLQTVDIPLQVRFRGSTAEKFNFWRVYAGLTFSWVYKNSSTFKDENIKVRYYDIPYLNEWLYSANLQVGYGKFTVKVDYTLGTLFKKKYAGDALPVSGLSDMRSCNVGLLVYIL